MVLSDQEKLIKYLISAEKLADEILNSKQEIILLDKRRNQNREALRQINSSADRKCWLTIGSVLVKHDIETARSFLEADQQQLNIDINKLRSELKIKVNDLRDLEMQPPVPGMMLVPMNHNEKSSLMAGGIFNL